MKLDPTMMADWQIAEAAEENIKPFEQLGLAYGELLPIGSQLAKIDYLKVLKRLEDASSSPTFNIKGSAAGGGGLS